MTTQLPNGYEAVKVPEGIRRIELSVTCDALGYWHNEIWTIKELQGIRPYTLLGRADELTEEQCRKIVKGLFDRHWYDYLSIVPSGYAPGYTFFTALDSFRSLLASLHLEPHTTIILKKENV